jgi:hypothetical protein
MISIVYITFRENCRFEWFIESLMNQTNDEQRATLQLIVVDGFLFGSDEERRRAYFRDLVGGKIELVHVSPKPTKWQGQYRVTSENYFAAANTRNTGACYAKHPYLVFVDDLGVLGPHWFEGVLEGAQKERIYCGAYTKVKDIVVEGGRFIGGNTEGGVDSRLSIYKDDLSECPGGHMFGSSFGIPIEIYFHVNGQNEMCDGVAGEDYDLGLRLQRLGIPLYYNKRMFIHESDYSFGSDRERKCIRSDPVVSAEAYEALMLEYDLLNHEGRKDLSHFLLAYGYHGLMRVNPEFSLEDYNRAICKEGVTDPFLKPTGQEIHFFTKKRVSEGLYEPANQTLEFIDGRTMVSPMDKP